MKMQCIRNFEQIFRSRQNSVFYFSAENRLKTPSQNRMAGVLFKTGRKSIFLLTSEGTGL